MALTTAGKMFLLNKDKMNITLDAGELFGFNVGNWLEVASGRK